MNIEQSRTRHHLLLLNLLLNCSTTNATIVGKMIHLNRFDLMDVSTICTPIAIPTVVNGDLFFRQGGDQLNGGRRGSVDLQPV
jgi:hypothetical protein